ncbi:MAG: sigma-70 family RNA polymerase sigma factor [Planctomycetota bacterium]|nr:sigma-70 family RNA polymerase sigma factor [Planctomycetota bacterium]MDP6954893.1 sigma-70 family RNA polymerase sigma factor [Planctomycetota bacterium]
MEDKDLVKGLKARNEETVEAFLVTYRSLLHHCIGHFTRNHASREDLYQDLVLYILERLDRDAFDPQKGSFGTWLYRVAWCRCVDLRRRESAQRRPQLTSVGDNIPERADERPGPVEVIGSEEIGFRVRAALDQLEPDERSLMDLRFVQGQTLGEISGALDMSLEQTKYRVKKATVSMRRVLLNDYAHQEVAD